MSRILRATAIGDAIGAGYEYVEPEVTENFRLSDGFRVHPLHTEIQPGMFTDDTMLSVASVRAILTDFFEREPTKKAPYLVVRRDTLAQAMVDLHRNHPHQGYSKHVYEALSTSEDGPAFDAFFDRTFRSDSNGAAMRSACYGVFPSLPFILGSTYATASLTHARGGVSGAQAVAAVSHYFYHRIGPKKDLNRWLSDNVSPIWTITCRERVAKQHGPLAVITVCAALTAIRTSRTLSEVIEKSVRVGGDVDTVAAIAAGLAVSCDEIEDDLPAGYWDGTLIQPVAGIDWDEITRLDTELDRLATVDLSWVSDRPK